MPINAEDLRRECGVCGQTFYAKAGALYCSTRCKQKAYDDRQRQLKTRTA